jgi:hypothetical protein
MPLILPIYEEDKMPDISKFKSVSVSTDTHAKLLSLAQNRFEVPVSVQKVIEFLLEKELKKKNGKSYKNK